MMLSKNTKNTEIRIWVERKEMDIPLRMWLETHKARIDKLKEGCYINGKYYLIEIAMVIHGEIAGIYKTMEILGTICHIINGICADFDVEIRK